MVADGKELDCSRRDQSIGISIAMMSRYLLLCESICSQADGRERTMPQKLHQNISITDLHHKEAVQVPDIILLVSEGSVKHILGHLSRARI